MRSFVFALSLVLFLSAFAGSGFSRAEEPQTQTQTQTQNENENENEIKRTIVFAMDSVNALSFKYAIDNGYCPNIKWLIDHGAYYENGVSVFPSVSLSSDFSILTGSYPGKHGILGWMWYNRSEGKYYSIDGAKIWDPVELQKMIDSQNWMSDNTETIFEVVESAGDAYTSALGTYAAKGADSSVFETLKALISPLSDSREENERAEGPAQSSLDTIAKGEEVELYTPETEEIESYFDLHWGKRVLFEGAVDSLLFMQMLLDVLRSKGYDNSLIYLWISGTDAAGHLMGGRSEAMLHSYQIVDAKIGIVMSLVKLLGMEDETLFVIAGNHGIKGMNEKLFERIGYRDMVGVYSSIIDSGLEYIAGNRGIYLPNATIEEIDSLAREIVKDRFVDLTMYKNETETITVIGDHGTSEIDVKRWGNKISDTDYDYRVIEGSDPLAEGDELAYSPFYGFQPEDLNKNPTPMQYPMAIERILGLFCSPDAPDLVITIGGEASGQHGDLGYEESVVPIIFSGPGIKNLRSEETVSIVNIAPTITKAMGLREPGGSDGSAFNIFGSDEEYSLPLINGFYLPIYIPCFRPGFSFLMVIPFFTTIRDLICIPGINRIASIGYVRSLLPDPPEYIDTFNAEVFRTFIL